MSAPASNVRVSGVSPRKTFSAVDSALLKEYGRVDHSWGEEARA
jgi:hypothetical protein